MPIRREDLSWQITAIRPADLPAVAALEQECALNQWGIASYLRELEHPSAIMLVASRLETDNGKTDQSSLLGFLAGRVAADEFEIRNLAVSQGHRRQGIGAALLRAGLRAAGKQGAIRAVLEVRAANLPALALYHRHGFACVGKRRAYYRDPPDDAWIMACEGAAWRAMVERGGGKSGKT
jgi:ribosomal-protein-alanine N-acetyltransferase